MYTTTNYKTKKALKDAVKAGEQVTYFQPGPYAGNEPDNGTIFIEGPHYPQPHRFYAQATIENGVIVKVK